MERRRKAAPPTVPGLIAWAGVNPARARTEAEPSILANKAMPWGPPTRELEHGRHCKAKLASYNDMYMSLYDLNPSDIALFGLAASALLGSPGPGIAALVVAGRSSGISGGLRFYWGMQLGLALAAALCAVGLASLLSAVPAAGLVLTAVSTAYLIWLAWRIASASVGEGTIGERSDARFSMTGGFLLGFANPKAFLAFVSLFGSFSILETDPTADGLAKWTLCVAIMLVVDFAWLTLGAGLGVIRLGPPGERAMNWAMGFAVLSAALLTLL